MERFSTPPATVTDREGSEPMTSAVDPPKAVRTANPLFSLCGCLVVLVVAASVGALISFWMVLSGGLQDSPLLLPELQRTDGDLQVIADLGDSTDDMTLTHAQWNLFLTDQVDQMIAAGEVSPGSGVRLLPQPDGQTRLLVSIGIPEDQSTAPWWLRGRFANLEMIGTATIHGGNIDSADVDLYQWGSIYKGENLDQQQSIEVLDKLFREFPLSGISLEIRELEFVQDKLRIVLNK